MPNSNFAAVAAVKGCPRWEELTRRASSLYSRPDDVRSPFDRDYTRILHSYAYRRLKHKTQVFFNVDNDHICTRMEHVAHVESVSATIAKALGLNTELTHAIAIGHDLGHAPFGHQGEAILNQISQEYLNERFWHERNGLRFVDEVELLEDNYNCPRNLDLTYAVRDGIISHCGEVDENGLIPREEWMDLDEFRSPGQYAPATWEGCVVKLSDKIAYIGRDIEDAAELGFLDADARRELLRMARTNDENVLNTTVITHNLIIDVCENSSPEKGICLSPPFYQQLNELKRFNTETIYRHKRLEPFLAYSELILRQLFKTLLDAYDEKYLWRNLKAREKYSPILTRSFEEFLAKYCDPSSVPEAFEEVARNCKNKKIYGGLSTREIYIRAIMDYISGMTDRFAIKVFNELMMF